ncbi:hypothetical protein DBR28_12675 [Chryseobacterium sp. HMWF028]|nr:hypothetical protein DBR28_12675 [Chryseobacterium sp. HMWF028]
MNTIKSTLLGISLSINVVAQTNEQGLFPKIQYADGTLGKKLQSQFGKHCISCSAINEILPKRDYIPKEIKNFDRQDLSKIKVESISINSSSLLRYVFLEEQRNSTLEDGTFTLVGNKVLQNISNSPQDFSVIDDVNFPSYIYTTNCASMINLVAKGQGNSGAAALSAAVDIDNKRNSGLYIYSGVFQSPLNAIISAKNGQTTELMFNLWEFYRKNPNYIGKAYYLDHFRGLTIGRTTSSDQYRKMESTVGINISAAMASLNMDASASLKTKSTFSGTDFQTFIYNDFNNQYTRESLFERLPNIDEIIAYFKPTSLYSISFSGDNQLMANGNAHSIYLDLVGVPPSFINLNKWKLSKVDINAYEPNTAELISVFTTPGRENSARFVISGIPNAKHFSDKNNPAGNILVSFSIESMDAINNKNIEIPFSKKINTTAHPIPKIASKAIPYSFTKSSNEKFLLSWKVPITFIDREKPVNYTPGNVANVSSVELNVNGTKTNAQAILMCSPEGNYELSITTSNEFPIKEYTLIGLPSNAIFRATIDIPLKVGGISQKPIDINLEFPDTIKKTETAFIATIN